MANETIATEQECVRDTAQCRERWLCAGVIAVRVIVGVTFIVSGGVKLIDPEGTMYKIEEYLTVVGLTSLVPLSLVASVVLSMVEFVIGVNTLLGSYRRVTPVLLAVFMGVMTPLTLYLAIANPIHDCGCFGDAIVLTNWQTFWKNVVLVALVCVLLRYNKRVRSLFHPDVQSLTVLFALLYAFIVAWMGYTYQPLIDFRPYKPGVDLRAALDGNGVADREYDFIYEREGEQRVFSLDNLPSADDGWRFVERRERAVPQADANEELGHFAIYDGDENVTDRIVGHDGYVFIMFSPDIRKASDDEVNKINELYDYCCEYGYPFYAVSPSSPRATERWLEDTGGEYSFYFMDKITIRTIARNNPYVLVLKDGVICRKGTPSMLPDESKLNDCVENTDWPGTVKPYEVAPRVWWLVGVLLVPLLLLLATERAALFVVRRMRNFYRDRKAKYEKNRGKQK